MQYLNSFPFITNLIINHTFPLKSIPLLNFQSITELKVADWNKHIRRFTTLTVLRVSIQHIPDIRRVLESAQSISTLKELYISTHYGTFFRHDYFLQKVGCFSCSKLIVHCQH